MSFIPNIWANKWNLAFKERSLVMYITKTDFTSGQSKGDRVTVSRVSGGDVVDYVKGTPITYDSVISEDVIVQYDKQKLFAPLIEDIDEYQTNPSLMEGVLYDGANKMVKQVDTDVLAKIVADANTEGNTITAGATLTKANVVDELLIPARQFLNAADAPDEGRYIVVDATTEGLIQGADLTLADAGLEKNLIGRTMGMSIYWSNNLPASRCVIGVQEATEFGKSIKKVKRLDSEDQVGEIVQMLDVYGSGVIKPEGVAEFVLV